MQAKRGLSEQGMSAFGRGTVRTVLLSGLSAVGIACAASFSFADSLPYLSPEAPPSFGDLADASPLVAIITAQATRSPALGPLRFAEPKFDLASSDETRPREGDLAAIAAAPKQAPAPPDIPPPVVYDPTVGPSLSPTQSALQAALWRLAARAEKTNPPGHSRRAAPPA